MYQIHIRLQNKPTLTRACVIPRQRTLAKLSLPVPPEAGRHSALAGIVAHGSVSCRPFSHPPRCRPFSRQPRFLSSDWRIFLYNDLAPALIHLIFGTRDPTRKQPVWYGQGSKLFHMDKAAVDLVGCQAHCLQHKWVGIQARWSTLLSEGPVDLRMPAPSGLLSEKKKRKRPPIRQPIHLGVLATRLPSHLGINNASNTSP